MTMKIEDEDGYNKFEIAIGEYYCISSSKHENLFQIQSDMPNASKLFRDAVEALIKNETENSDV